jgi:hypothetical protein
MPLRPFFMFRFCLEALRSANAPVTAEALAKQFLRAKKKDVMEILETIGHAKRDKELKTFSK